MAMRSMRVNDNLVDYNVNLNQTQNDCRFRPGALPPGMGLGLQIDNAARVSWQVARQDRDSVIIAATNTV